MTVLNLTHKTFIIFKMSIAIFRNALQVQVHYKNHCFKKMERLIKSFTFKATILLFLGTFSKLIRVRAAVHRFQPIRT